MQGDVDTGDINLDDFEIEMDRIDFVDKIRKALGQFDGATVKVSFIKLETERQKKKKGETHFVPTYLRLLPVGWSIDTDDYAKGQIKLGIKEILEIKLGRASLASDDVFGRYENSYTQLLEVAKVAPRESKRSPEIWAPLERIKKLLDDGNLDIESSNKHEVDSGGESDFSEELSSEGEVGEGEVTRRTLMCCTVTFLGDLPAITLLQKITPAAVLTKKRSHKIPGFELVRQGSTYTLADQVITFSVNPDALYLSGEFFVFNASSFEDSLCYKQVFNEKAPVNWEALKKKIKIQDLTKGDDNKSQIVQLIQRSPNLSESLAAFVRSPIFEKLTLKLIKACLKTMKAKGVGDNIEVDEVGGVTIWDIAGLKTFMDLCLNRLAIPLTDSTSVVRSNKYEKLKRNKPVKVSEQQKLTTAARSQIKNIQTQGPSGA